jgi:hypothetical protein
MEIASAREREMLDLFHNQFVPEAVKHEGYIRVKKDYPVVLYDEV